MASEGTCPRPNNDQQEGRWHLHSDVREGGGHEAPERGLQQPELPTAIAVVLNYLSNHFQN